jgi:NADH-quinone oxidoreductase subunit L
MIAHGFKATAFYLLLGGVVLAWLCYSLMPNIPKLLAPVFAIPSFILTRKYGFDWLYIKGFARLGIGIGKKASALGDRILIDGLMVNGAANVVRGVSMQLRKIQSGYLYQYAFAMIIGLLALLTYFYFQI